MTENIYKKNIEAEREYYLGLYKEISITNTKVNAGSTQKIDWSQIWNRASKSWQDDSPMGFYDVTMIEV